MGCQARYEQLHNVETALGQLERVGFGPGTPAYDTLYRERGAILGRMGRERPKQVLWLEWALSLSPEVLRPFFDTEVGWLVEAKATPWADPIYHTVTAEEAIAILQGKVSPELKERLLTPTTYLGEE